MPVVGDFRKLEMLSERMKRFSLSHRAPLMKSLAATAAKLAQDCFLKQRDPYGEPWQALKRGRKRNKGSLQILRDTNRLMNSIHYGWRSSGSGISCSSNVKYAAVHNYGGSIKKSGQVNRHSRFGRFQKRHAPAGRSVRISFSSAHEIKMPKRQFIPYSDDIGSIWNKELRDTVTDFMEVAFRGV